MVWDFAEANILADVGWVGACGCVLKVIANNALCSLPIGTAESASATAHLLPDDTVDAFVTDPPYYAAIPYADLSDFSILGFDGPLGKSIRSFSKRI
jgi:adenine-specific DNA methylase